MKNSHPRIGIRPIIDGRRGGIRESLEEMTMGMAQSVAKLYTEKLRYADGTPVECVIADRTIGGVEMAGRTYKNVGMWWTEYYGEMPTGGWLAIKISGVDIDPGTEGDTVLNSITFG